MASRGTKYHDTGWARSSIMFLYILLINPNMILLSFFVEGKLQK